MDWRSINHIIDCGLRRVVKPEALRTKKYLGKSDEGAHS